MEDYEFTDKFGDEWVIFKDKVVNPKKWGLYKKYHVGVMTLVSLYDTRELAIEASELL